MNDVNTTALPTKPETVLESIFRPNPFIKNPSNGKIGINQTNLKILFIISLNKEAFAFYVVLIF